LNFKVFKVMDIVGARPQFIKLAPILRAIEQHNKLCVKEQICEILLHTGQHYDYLMSQVFFDELGIKAPDYHLGVGSGTHGYQTGEMLKRIEEVLLNEKPDLVIVYGDTNSTLAGALASAKLRIPVAHVEAGLRCFNKRVPEEINRILTDHVSDLLFCPTETAVKNLKLEGITEGVHFVGDVMYDAVLMYLEVAEDKSDVLSRFGLEPKGYALATIHRAENTDNLERLSAILEGLERIAEEGMKVVFPIHPRTKKQITAIGWQMKGVRVFEPVSYLDMLVLEKNAHLILTDSGGVQKEAFFFRVPCITLREQTEWIETVETGWNTLVGCDPDRIVEAATRAKPGRDSAFPYGDGKAGLKIVEIVCAFLRSAKEQQ